MKKESLIRVSPEYFKHVQVDIQPERGIAYLTLLPVGYPCFSPALLRELKQAQEKADEYNCKYLVFSSDVEGVFNFGGDVKYISEQVKGQNKRALSEYMRACIAALYHESTVDERIRIAVVQGDCFGGGFESVLCCDKIIAEEGSRFHFPEIKFGLFPGMGAFSYLIRRTNMLVAKRIITSNQVYSSHEMFMLGVIDQVVGSGVGMQTAKKYIWDYEQHHNAYNAIWDIANSVSCDVPVSYDELIVIGDKWVDCALKLTDRDLRIMDRISSLQTKYVGSESGE